MKSTERFSNRVDHYIRYRPHYPAEIIPFLEKEIKLNNRWVVADIGSGTGISAEFFLQNGNKVYCVEPNLKMRNAAEAMLKKDKNFVSINGTAEATTLPNENIDLIVAGQAFHWFDKVAAKKEFQRIAKSEAYLLLMWNERNLENAFQQAYEQMLLEYVPDYEEVCQRQIDESVINDFFFPHMYRLEVFANEQEFDLEGLKGRLLSCSYAPLEGTSNYKPLILRLEEIFKEFNVNGKVKFEYLCKLYYGLISPKSSFLTKRT